MNNVKHFKTGLQYLLGKFPLYHRLYQYYSEKNFKDYYGFVLRSQWFSLKEIETYQNRHLQQIVKHTYDNVPFYKKHFDEHKISVNDIRSSTDLMNIPLINKNMLKLHHENFKSLGHEKYNPVINMTSGSTGIPLKIAIDQNVNTLANALVWRHFNWAGRKFYHKTVYIGPPFGFGTGYIDSKSLYEINSTKTILKINSALISLERLGTICEILKRFRPYHIVSYPSLITIFAKYIMNKHNYNIRPHSISLRAEKLYPEQRMLIERAFHCPCFEFYGMWEYLVFAAECEYHNLHLNFELGITEIIKNGRLCDKGEVGEIVATGIHNHSMPLMRYAIGDYGCIKNENCKCGRQMPIIDVVGSRDKDLIITRKGFFNIMSGLPLTFGNDNKIKQIQFYQEDKESLIIRIVKEENFSDSDKEKMRAAISNYLLDSIHIIFEFVDHIPRTEAGKYMYVVSKVPLEI